jgi:hypothetical protein
LANRTETPLHFLTTSWSFQREFSFNDRFSRYLVICLRLHEQFETEVARWEEEIK